MQPEVPHGMMLSGTVCLDSVPCANTCWAPCMCPGCNNGMWAGAPCATGKTLWPSPAWPGLPGPAWPCLP